MSLAAAVAVRVPNHVLVQLTNRDDNTATTVNATVLAQACSDTEEKLKVYGGAEYDDSNPQHPTACVPMVLALLRMWSQGLPVSDEYRFCVEQIKDASRIGPRDRFAPTSSSQLTPSTEVPSGETVRPRFDAEAFDGFLPTMP